MAINTKVKRNFGEKIREMRKERGMSQQAICKAIGISPSLLSRIENETEKFTASEWSRFCEVTGTDASRIKIALRDYRRVSKSGVIAEMDSRGKALPDPAKLIPVFGRIVRDFRLKSGIGQVELAKSLDISQANISRIEAGIYEPIVQFLSFPVSGSANEPLLYAKINGQKLTLSADQKSFSGTYSVPTEGNYTLHFEVADLATNVTTRDIPIQVILKVLNGDLLSVAPSPDGVHLTINGAPGATRPGITVNASASFFNNGSAVGKADGSFSINLFAFQTATLTATDPSLGRTDTATVTFGSGGGTLLSGNVRDTSNNPLAGVTVSIANAGISTVTDGSGVFKFSQSVTGDQILIVDGTTIPRDPTATVQKKFSITRVAISIGLSQSSVHRHTAPH